MTAAPSLPTLSQVQTLDTTYLPEAQQYWSHTGNLWDQVFTEINETMSTPGATPWTGQAASAGQVRAYIDMIKVRGATYQLHEAAEIAGRGEGQLQARKGEVLEAVRAARADGFEVGEDYSVTDRIRGGSAELRSERLAEAEAHAAFIRHRVGALVAADQELTRQITAATREIDDLTFDESPADTNDKHNRVRPVDQHWKQDPTQNTGHSNGPSADDIRRVLDKLPRGDKPSIREVFSQQDLDDLWNWVKQQGVERPGGYGKVPGEIKELPDGTILARREAADSTNQPVMDVRFPVKDGYIKVHINPRGGVPDLPTRARPAPAEARPALPKPAQAAPLPDEVPKLPFGPGLTAHSPATGPHPVYGPEHHRVQPPLLGDEPDEVP
jgi:hypothetical protein